MSDDDDYAGQYYSESKERWIPFGEMHDRHLLNAWRKLGASYYDTTHEGEQHRIAAKVLEIECELIVRGYERTPEGWQRPDEGESA